MVMTSFSLQLHCRIKKTVYSERKSFHLKVLRCLRLVDTTEIWSHVCVCVYIYIYIYIYIYMKNKKRKYLEQHCDLAFQPTYLHSIWLRSHHRAEGRSLPYHDLKFVWYLGPKAKILSVICMNQLILTLFTALKLIAIICNWVLSHISYLYGSKFKQLKLMNRL